MFYHPAIPNKQKLASKLKAAFTHVEINQAEFEKIVNEIRITLESENLKVQKLKASLEQELIKAYQASIVNPSGLTKTIDKIKALGYKWEAHYSPSWEATESCCLWITNFNQYPKTMQSYIYEVKFTKA